jgi:hypothetical protein
MSSAGGATRCVGTRQVGVDSQPVVWCGVVWCEQKKAVIPDARKAEQKRVDTAVLAAVNKTPLLKQYLKSRFSLTKGVYPHQLKF